MSDVGRIAVIIALVLGNAVFVAAEYALVTARRSRLEEREESGSRAARTALKLMDEPVRFISTAQVGITVFGIALGAIGEPLLSHYLDFLPRGAAFAIAFAVLTYLSVVRRRARPEGDRAAEGGAAGARARAPARRPLPDPAPARVAAPGLVRGSPAADRA